MSALNTDPKKKKTGMVGGKRKQLSEHKAIQSGCTVQTKSDDTKKSGPDKRTGQVTWYFAYARLTWTSSNSNTKVTDDLHGIPRVKIIVKISLNRNWSEIKDSFCS